MRRATSPSRMSAMKRPPQEQARASTSYTRFNNSAQGIREPRPSCRASRDERVPGSGTPINSSARAASAAAVDTALPTTGDWSALAILGVLELWLLALSGSEHLEAAGVAVRAICMTLALRPA